MKHILLTTVVIAGLAVSGCASNFGTQTVNDFNRYTQLEPGETTISEIYESFGQPHQVEQIVQTSERVWTYYSIRERTNASTYVPFVGLVTGGSDVDATAAAFYFDRNDILLRSERDERSRYKNMWLALGDAATRSGDVAAVESEMNRLGLPFDEQAARQHAQAIDMFAD
jgi:hypothetical protein